MFRWCLPDISKLQKVIIVKIRQNYVLKILNWTRDFNFIMGANSIWNGINWAENLFDKIYFIFGANFFLLKSAFFAKINQFILTYFNFFSKSFLQDQNYLLVWLRYWNYFQVSCKQYLLSCSVLSSSSVKWFFHLNFTGNISD